MWRVQRGCCTTSALPEMGEVAKQAEARVLSLPGDELNCQRGRAMAGGICLPAASSWKLHAGWWRTASPGRRLGKDCSGWSMMTGVDVHQCGCFEGRAVWMWMGSGGDASGCDHTTEDTGHRCVPEQPEQWNDNHGDDDVSVVSGGEVLESSSHGRKALCDLALPQTTHSQGSWPGTEAGTAESQGLGRTPCRAVRRAGRVGDVCTSSTPCLHYRHD